MDAIGADKDVAVRGVPVRAAAVEKIGGDAASKLAMGFFGLKAY